MRLLAILAVLCTLTAAPRAQAIPVKAFDAPLFVHAQPGAFRFAGTPPGSLKPLLRDVLSRWFGEDRPVQTAFGATIAAWRGEDWIAIIIAKAPSVGPPPRLRDWFGTSIPALGPDGYVEVPGPGPRSQDIAAIPLGSALPFLVTGLLALGLAGRQRAARSGAPPAS